MPLYEYGCSACGTTTEVRHGFDDTPVLKCEKCGAALSRWFSAPPMVFMGSVFYVTDSRKSSSSDAKSSDAKTDAKPAAGAEAKSETKSEAKAETKSEPASESKSETKSDTKSESKSEGSSAKKSDAAA